MPRATFRPSTQRPSTRSSPIADRGSPPASLCSASSARVCRPGSTRDRGANGRAAAWRSSVADFIVRPAAPEDLEAAFALFAEWQVQVYGEVEMGPEMFEARLA